VAHRSGALAANRDLVGVPGCTRLRSIIQETFLAAAMIAMHVTSRPAAITLAVGTSTPTRRSAPGEHLSTLCPAAVDQVHVQAALIDDTAVGRHDVTGAQYDDVTSHHSLDRDGRLGTVAYNVGLEPRRPPAGC